MVKGFYPQTMEALVDLKHKYPQAIIYAGGTDFMVTKERIDYEEVIFLEQMETLKKCSVTEDETVIGACVTYSQLLENQELPDLLIDAISSIAAPGIRNAGTLVGNVCNASPAGDTLPVLYALDASVVLNSVNGTRILPIETFIKGVRHTAIKPEEVVTAIKWKTLSYNKSSYVKIGARRAQAISKLSMASLAMVDNGVIKTFRCAFGSIGPTVIRNLRLEKKIEEKINLFDPNEVDEILQQYGKIIQPIDDQRSTAEYRKTVALNLLEDFLYTIST